jgi:hypothetical protein
MFLLIVMEQRVLFRKEMQRKFFDLVIEKLNCISLRGILQFGINCSHASLKNYYTERRLIPKNLFENLVHLAKIDVSSLNVKYINPYWGQIKGGKGKS